MAKSEHYENPAATATLIIESEEGMCYVERKHEPYKGKKALPGGFADCGKETLEQAACRELKEETNLDAQPSDLELLMVNSSPTRDPRGHVIDHVYIVKKYKGTPKAGDDAAKIYWIPVNETPNLAFDHNIAIEKYKLWKIKNEQ